MERGWDGKEDEGSGERGGSVNWDWNIKGEKIFLNEQINFKNE